MSTPPDSNEDAELDKLLAELEKEPSEELNNSEIIKDKQASDTLGKLKHDKPEWVDKKNDDYNAYEYSDKLDEDDEKW